MPQTYRRHGGGQTAWIPAAVAARASRRSVVSKGSSAAIVT